jgi:hypothetical protein
VLAPMHPLHDSGRMEEAELVAQLIVAASETDDRLPEEQIDLILGLYARPRPDAKRTLMPLAARGSADERVLR